MINNKTQSFYEKNIDYCTQCDYNKNNLCDGVRPHIYGANEAKKWNGKYTYYCENGTAFIANSVYEDNINAATIILGPFSIDNDDGNALGFCIKKSVVSISPKKVTALSEIVSAVALYLSADTLNINVTANIHDMMDTMYNLQSSESYPIEHEKELQSAIAVGDKKKAQEILNLLLGHIYFYSGGDYNVIKTRITELIVLLSRASIDGGADVKHVFTLSKGYLREIEKFTNLDELGAWISKVMHSFISFIFDFVDVKHIDVIQKIIAYINQHYSEKISLDDLASHVFLSKSYLSHTFNSQLGCSFTTYINKVRIEKSKILLLNSKYSLVEISMLVGFDEQSYFNKVFKKIVGKSPGKFKKERG